MSNDILEKILGSAGYGSHTSSITKTLSGIDHRRISSTFQKNTDSQGLVLFGRPNMNLSHDNLLSDRRLSPLIRSATDENVKDPQDIDALSLSRAIRCTLDPRSNSYGITSKLVDSRTAFIPLYTNTLLTLSGWPDISMDTYSTPAGVRKESIAQIDSVAETNEIFNLTGTFANIEGDPITTMSHYWNIYSGGVYGDDLMPYPRSIITNAKDYETRIWRLVLDKSQRYVRKIASAIAIPLVTPSSLSLNYTRDSAFATDGDQLTIPFLCQCAEYNDPILYEEFNITVQMYNKSMTDANRETLLTKLSPNEIRYFNFEGYPRINPLTLELEWWIGKEEYKDRLSQIFGDRELSKKILNENGYISNINNGSGIDDPVNKEFNLSTTMPTEKSSAEWYRTLVQIKEQGGSLQQQAEAAIKMKAAKLKEEESQ